MLKEKSFTPRFVIHSLTGAFTFQEPLIIVKSMFCCCLVASVAVLSVSSVFAALYRDFLNTEGKLSSDAREIDYCRAAVDPANTKMLDGSKVPASSEIWTYTTKPSS